jgi:hypothetical protein
MHLLTGYQESVTLVPMTSGTECRCGNTALFSPAKQLRA